MATTSHRGLVELFRKEIEERPGAKGWDTGQRGLEPGLMAAATHGVIRTGHATRSITLDGSLARRRELAGLAYWAAEYMSFQLAPHRRFARSRRRR